ncbi:MAG: OmpA family protein [Pseudoflavonifractor sp.]|nr:OmpA family protein [Alloprevotella sp.]MCM1117335.1 OmpA family protein [Pseudoflavonifractor sp.]
MSLIKSATTVLAVCILSSLLSLSCKGPKLATADEQMARGEYFDASRTYRKIYNKTKRDDRLLRAEIAWKMAECHDRLKQSARASAAYQNAIRYGWPDSIAQLRLAQNLQAEGKYAAAIKAYDDFLSIAPDNAEALTGLDGSRMSLEAKERKSRYIVRNAKLFNSRRSDFSPMFSGDILYFTSTNEKATGDNKSEITGMKRGDIWLAKKNERGEWQRPQAAEGELNTEHDEGICSFSPDGSVMYLTRAVRRPTADTRIGIFTSQRSDAKWSASVELPITSDTVSNHAHPAISPSGDWLYFSSDMPGEGGRDLWRINIKERAGSLENLGPWINTPGDEVFPYVLSDSVIYFASDGHPGLGGLDLFKATLTHSGGWKVENLGAPINSSADDFGITFESPDKEKGFFSSNRGDARGYDHIYSFELPDLNILISGYVVDVDDEPVPGAVIRIVGRDGSNRKAVARDDGSFSFPLERGVSYAMLASAKGYLNAKQEFTSDIAEEDAEYGVDFVLASINKPNIVENIFYDFDKATLRPESTAALDSLATLLRDNPNITIEMSSHTDRVGSDQYNNALSERRAKSVVDYLIAAGISPARLQFQGYGKSRPKRVTKRINKQFPQFPEGTLLDEDYVISLSEEDREAADQINRRTEFTVLSTDYEEF